MFKYIGKVVLIVYDRLYYFLLSPNGLPKPPRAGVRTTTIFNGFANGPGMEISEGHPRYRSLVVREHMSELVRQGVVAPTGLIAHGRGEAFDYMLGEQTTPTAVAAARVAAAHLLEARRPVITINGNAAGLCAEGLLSLARVVPAKVEVNLFHRSPERVEKVVSYLEARGGTDILGREQGARLEAIASDRAACCTDGIFSADAVLIPLEDGDRAGALVRAGKTVLAIDLNPLSRTALEAHVTVVDELTRAVPNIERAVLELKNDPEERRRLIREFSNSENLHLSREAMCLRLRE
jgi:4-phosphopantoate--beta-alanine ligase